MLRANYFRTNVDLMICILYTSQLKAYFQYNGQLQAKPRNFIYTQRIIIKQIIYNYAMLNYI